MGEKTYQELTALGENETARMQFLRQAVAAHKGTPEYRIAKDAEEYYAKRNVTILKYQKFIMNTLGQQIPDIWSANYKLTHSFFRRFVIQQVQYVLSNGVSFEKRETKEKLGKRIDNVLQKMAKKSMVDGVSFGFWNLDHLEVFSFVDTKKEAGFVPLFDEDTGELKAGIRYWSPSAKSNRWTLYELDGYTEYIQRKGEDIIPLGEKKKYQYTATYSESGGVESVVGENYSGFPIIPLYANDLQESELVGIRASIDCYDFIKSGMANNIDETSAFYWTIEGAGMMDDTDLVSFVNRMKQLKAVVLDPDVKADAHTLEVPVEANKMLLDYLKSDMYEDMMLLNTKEALSGDKTATSIRMAYQPQDDKCGDFEYCIRDFLFRLFDLTGIDDEPSFTWNRIANQAEETQMVMTAAPVLDDEAVLKHLPWLLPEEVDEIMTRKAAEPTRKTEELPFDEEDEESAEDEEV